MERVFILGADDPEMREIERVLRDRNERIVHAVKDGERVPEVAINLANYLQELGHWTAEGDAEWCDHWDTGKPFDPKDTNWIQSLEEYGYQKP